MGLGFDLTIVILILVAGLALFGIAFLVVELMYGGDDNEHGL